MDKEMLLKEYWDILNHKSFKIKRCLPRRVGDNRIDRFVFLTWEVRTNLGVWCDDKNTHPAINLEVQGYINGRLLEIAIGYASLTGTPVYPLRVFDKYGVLDKTLMIEFGGLI